MFYFNHNASSYPKPPSVIKAICQQASAPPISTGRSSNKVANLRENCRQKLAHFFNTSDDIIFTSGSTEALNLVIFGLSQPKHIITTVTEHNSVVRPLKHLEKEQNVQVDFIPCDQLGFVDPKSIEAAIKTDTTAIIINHCSNVTGCLQDLAEISKIAQQYNISLIVDASQSAGAAPIDLSQIHIDALIFTGHKNLWACAGIGGLILKPTLKLRPLKVGGTGSRSDLLYQPKEHPHYYEAGTPNAIGLAALSAGLDYIQEKGLEYIQAEKHARYLDLVNGIQDLENIRFVAYPDDLDQHIPVLNIEMEGMSNADLAYILEYSYDISIREGLHCASLIHEYLDSTQQGTVRISCSHLNTPKEVDYLIQTLREIAHSCIL